MLQELQAQLRLKRYPQRIECFDISMIHGANAVGSQVTFIGGEPDKAHYRHYRIRTIDASSGGDDFGMMLEVLKRRFTRGKREEEMPDLVVVDGGKGQLAMALAAMREVGVEGSMWSVLPKCACNPLLAAPKSNVPKSASFCRDRVIRSR